jgi:hypothetical protein
LTSYRRRLDQPIVAPETARHPSDFVASFTREAHQRCRLCAAAASEEKLDVAGVPVPLGKRVVQLRLVTLVIGWIVTVAVSVTATIAIRSSEQRAAVNRGKIPGDWSERRGTFCCEAFARPESPPCHTIGPRGGGSRSARAKERRDADKFSEALALFKQSYDAVSSPNSHMMIGRTLVKLGQLPDACRELTMTMQQATVTGALQKKYKMTISAAQKELDDIKDKLAYVTLQPGSKVQIQGQNVTATRWLEPQPVMPGTVVVEAQFASGRHVTKQLMLKPGETTEVAVEPPPETPTTTSTVAPGSVSPSDLVNGSAAPGVSRKTLGYIFGAVGIAGVGAFVDLELA